MQTEQIIRYDTPLERRTYPDPAPQGSEVLVRLTSCGVCHSDVHLRDGYVPLGGDDRLDMTAGRTLPFTLGHEMEGNVAALGPEADGVTVGQRVAVFPWIGCGTCVQCRQGNENLCFKPCHMGINVDGGFADHIIVPHARYLLDCGDLEPGRAGCLMCSGLTAFGALKKAPPLGPEDPLLIIGAGGVGLMSVKLARHVHPRAPLLVADIRPSARETALEAGAHAVYDPSEKAELKRLAADSGGVATVIDFVGASTTVKTGSRAIRRGGCVIVVGLFGGMLSLPTPLLPIQAMTIAGSFVGTLAEASALIALARAGQVDTIPMERRGLGDANRSLDDLAAGTVTGRIVLSV